jgi:hypothetical protein
LETKLYDPEYGTGPEDKIAELGFGAEGAWVAGQAENGGLFLAMSPRPLMNQTDNLGMTNITQAEALDFCLA